MCVVKTSDLCNFRCVQLLATNPLFLGEITLHEVLNHREPVEMKRNTLKITKLQPYGRVHVSHPQTKATEVFSMVKFL
jgi:hypothetical protein